MSGRTVGSNAVVVDDPDGNGTITFLPGTSESQIPKDIAETFGDHVWEQGAGAVGVEAQREATARNRTVGPDGPVVQEQDPALAPAVSVSGETADDLIKLSKDELVERAEAAGVPHSGTKEDIVANLLDAQ